MQTHGWICISRIDFSSIFLFIANICGRKEERRRWWQRFAAGVGGGGLKKATTEAAITSGAGSPSASSRKVWRNTCTRCNEAGRLVCESNNNTSYLARTMCSAGRVCKLRRNVKQKNDKRETRAIPPSYRAEKGRGQGRRQVSEATLENISRSSTYADIRIPLVSYPPPPPPPLSSFYSRRAPLLFYPAPRLSISALQRLRPNLLPRVTSVSDL